MNKKLSLSAFVFISIFIVMWIISGFHTAAPDYTIYSNWYRETSLVGLTQRFEIGYSLSMLLGVKLGLSFEQFLAVFFAIGFVLIAKTIWENCEYPSIVAILYFIYPFFFDVVQIRNFMAVAIFLSGLKYLKEFNRKNFIKMCTLITLASCFHVTAIFYFLFLFSYIKSYKKITLIMFSFYAFGLVVYYISPSLVSTFATHFGNELYAVWGSSSNKVIGYNIIAIVAIAIPYIYYTKIKKDEVLLNDNYMVKTIPILLVAVIALTVTSQAYRLFRNMSLVLYITFLNESFMESNKKNVIRFNTAQLMFGIYAVFYSTFFHYKQLTGGMYEYVIKQILESNSLLK